MSDIYFRFHKQIHFLLSVRNFYSISPPPPPLIHSLVTAFSFLFSFFCRQFQVVFLKWLTFTTKTTERQTTKKFIQPLCIIPFSFSYFSLETHTRIGNGGNFPRLNFHWPFFIQHHSLSSSRYDHYSIKKVKCQNGRTLFFDQ